MNLAESLATSARRDYAVVREVQVSPSRSRQIGVLGLWIAAGCSRGRALA